MTPRRLLALLALAATWGASFLFIRIVVDDLGPVLVAWGRIAVAGAALGLWALARPGSLAVRGHWRGYLVMGLVNAALPFLLIALAELELPASLTAILNAMPPLWSALLVAVVLGEPLSARSAAGVAVGLLGVALVVGLAPVHVDVPFVLAAVAMAGSGLCYAIGSNYAQRRLTGVPPLAVATGQLVTATLILLPAVPAAPPPASPGLADVAVVLVLGLLCTAAAFVVYFRLLAALGSTGALTVTFLVPLFGVLWGALFLGEALRAVQGLGALVLLAGVALVTGVRPRDAFRRRGAGVASGAR
jgi:drug/metabolite transporter (DMT)-like permease